MVYILNSQGSPVPIGAQGEIHIGGAGVARGYLRRTQLTAERFVPDVFSDDKHARMYKTGDIGSWRENGTITYHGRNDQQVKIRGFRIELAEIEAQLLAHPGVREAVVVAHRSEGGTRLVGYVADGDRDLHSNALRAALGETLPDYMVPSAIVVLKSLPKNANGKIDRHALPEPELSNDHSYEAPQDKVEEMLAAICAEVLGIECIGRHDNFFELGGHSLTVMRLTALIRQRHGVELPMRIVFETPTVAALSAMDCVRSKMGRHHARQLSAIDALLAEME